MSGDGKAKRSFHGELEKEFVKVPEDTRIDTLVFLEASRTSVIPLLDTLGSTAFHFVKSDVNGNIDKLRKRYEENPERFQTLHDIVEDEIEREKTDAKNSATDALIWLIRGLYFICMFVKYVSEYVPGEDDSLQPCLQQAYDTALKIHHPWVTQKLIKVSFKAAPYYSVLLETLSNGADKAVIMEDIKEYVTVLEENINAIQEFYTKKELSDTPLKT